MGSERSAESEAGGTIRHEGQMYCDRTCCRAGTTHEKQREEAIFEQQESLLCIMHCNVLKKHHSSPMLFW